MPIKRRKTEIRDGINGLVCSKCEQWKPLDNFQKSNHCSRGTRPDCKECNNVSNIRYYYDNKDQRTKWQREFNKTEHRRAYVRNYQKNRWRKLRDQAATRPRPMLCECCGQAGKISFDHNHQNGEFRGWLCDRCNRVLGLCGDSIGILKALSGYLERRGSYADQRSVA